MQGKILFEEKQSFSRSPVWIIITIAALITIGVMVLLMTTGEMKWKEGGFSLAIMGGTYAIIFGAMHITRFETAVTTKGIYYRWTPFMKRHQFIPRDSLRQVGERKGPWMQYGYKWVPGYGRVHMVSGRQGIQLHLDEGRKVFIGTREPFLLRKALEKMLAKEKI